MRRRIGTETNMYPELIYSTPFFISSISIFIVGLFLCCQPRRSRGLWYLVFLCFAAAVWTATEGLLYLGFDIDTNMRITYLQHLGIIPLTPMLLLFTLSFFGYDAWLNNKTLMGLAVAAALILLLVWTNPLHRQVYVDYYRIDTGPIQMLGLHHGFIWWAIMAYHYALTALVGFLLYRTTRTTTGPLGRHATLLLVLVCTVWFFNGVYVSGNSPVPNMDLGPLAFILVAAAMAGGFYRHNFLGIHPVAKSAFFNTLEDPILVMDTQMRLLDLNPAAERLLGIRAAGFVGRNIEAFLKKRLQMDKLPKTPSDEILPIIVKDEKRYFELRASELTDKRGTDIGHLYFFHDITERKSADDAMREHERLQGVLEIAGSVCEDMAQPIDTIIECASQVLGALPDEYPHHDTGLKLSAQTKRLKETAHKLLGITRYETRSYLRGNIIDIEKASSRGEAQ